MRQQFPGCYEILGADVSGPALSYAESRGIPSGPILTIEEMFKHPQTAAREMLLRPLVGEHTDEILIIGHSFYLERNG